MKLTDRSRSILVSRRFRRDMEAEGYEEVGERGGLLWELYRGYRQTHWIVDVKIDPGGKSLWVKVQENPSWARTAA